MSKKLKPKIQRPVESGRPDDTFIARYAGLGSRSERRKARRALQVWSPDRVKIVEVKS